MEENGLIGYGEASAISYYGVKVEEMITQLEALKDQIEHVSYTNPKDFWLQIQPALKNQPFLLCALDVAMHDLYSKKQNLPLYKTLGLELKNIPISNYTIGFGTLEEMTKDILSNPWPVYKLKLTTSEDIELLPRLREITTSPFRVDANTGWSVKMVEERILDLKKWNIEFVEQPLKTDDWKGMKEVYVIGGMTYIADESCQSMKDIEKCATCFDAINVKVMKCGGITPALDMIYHAKKLGLKIMIGCMTESTVGISAIAHLLPLADYADIDGSTLLKTDVATGVYLSKGEVVFNAEQSGTGAVFLG